MLRLNKCCEECAQNTGKIRIGTFPHFCISEGSTSRIIRTINGNSKEIMD